MAESDQLRVVIVDDHPFFRQGLKTLLEKSGVTVVAEAANGLEAIDAVEAHAPDVVVMDLNMPGLSGAEATRRLNERMPSCKVLVLSVSAEEADVTEAILAGANGYMLKDGPVEDVVAGIQAVAAGESLISPKIAAMLLLSVRDREKVEAVPPPIPLSDRELQVLKLVSGGKTNREIAAALVIDSSTVRNHMSSILMKLQVDNRVQAAVRGIRDHLV